MGLSPYFSGRSGLAFTEGCARRSLLLSREGTMPEIKDGLKIGHLVLDRDGDGHFLDDLCNPPRAFRSKSRNAPSVLRFAARFCRLES